MARIIVMPNAKHLKQGIRGKVLYAEEVSPAHLDDLQSSEQILERLEGPCAEKRRCTNMPAMAQAPELTARAFHARPLIDNAITRFSRVLVWAANSSCCPNSTKTVPIR